MIKSYSKLCFCLSAFKLLFLKSYVSTDFDVHRNWMAITYNLPIRDWYYDSTSEWTLDYPPLFAGFEFLLAIIAHLLGLDDILVLSKKPLRSEDVVIFQKLSVIMSDIVYYYAVYKLSNTSLFKDDFGKRYGVRLLLLLQPGLMLVDHIHFQYNGFLSGVFLLSLTSIIEKNYASGSFWFAILLNLKHIYLYYAPAVGMYLLTSYCLAKSQGQRRIFGFISRTTKLGLVVISVFIITYAPYADLAQLKQILSRLFPFQRGLTHAYWAPNLWSLYNTADKILAQIFGITRKVKFDIDSLSRTKPVSSTSGLVQEYEHLYLPTIRPIHTFALVLLFTVPLVIKFLLNIGRHSPRLFIKGVTVASFTAFMFGWHVHEKAILLVILPMVILFCTTPRLNQAFLRLTLAGTYSLFPLLFERAEYVIKLSILIAYCCYAYSLRSKSGDKHQSPPAKSPLKKYLLPGRGLYNLLNISFVLAIAAVEVYITLIHGRLNYSWNPIAKLNKYDFLPLMLVSSLSALGVMVSYLELYYDFVCCSDDLARAKAAA